MTLRLLAVDHFPGFHRRDHPKALADWAQQLWAPPAAGQHPQLLRMAVVNSTRKEESNTSPPIRKS
jgi:hypothetical protein